MRAYFFCLLAALLLLAVPACAVTLTANDVSSYSFSADDGYVIYQIVIDDLPIGTNQTHTLYYNGYPYLLQVETWDDWGWKNARVTWTMPNGTVLQDSTSVLAPAIGLFGGYKTTIQPVFPQIYSGTSAYVQVHLQIGLVPVSSQFGTQPADWDPSDAIPFSAASGVWTGTESTNVFVEEITTQDFIDHVTKYDPVYGVTNLGGQVFQWTWDMVIGFIYSIPVFGPMIVQFIEIAGAVLGFFLYWTVFMVVNAPAIFAAAEVVIWAFALINAGSGVSAFGRFFRNAYQYHLSLCQLAVGLFHITRDLVVSIIRIVTSVVQALKPI